MSQDLANNIGHGVKKTLGTFLKAAGMAIGITVAGGIIGGVIAAAAAPAAVAGFFVTLGGVGIGVVGGGYLGGFAARSYLSSKAGPAIVAAGKIVDDINKELDANGQDSLGKQLGVEKELGEIFGKKADKKPAAEVTPLVATPAPAPKTDAPTP